MASVVNALDAAILVTVRLKVIVLITGSDCPSLAVIVSV